MDQRRKNEIIAVVLFAVSLFMFLSIFTFREQDISFYTSSPNAVPHNGTGIIGSYLGALLLFFMGKASYVIPCLLMVWGVMRLLQMQEHKIFFKLFGTVVLVAAVSASLSMVSGAGRVLAFSNGGLLGSVSADFLLGYLGPVGAAVFVAATMILSMLVATEFMLLPLILSAFKLARRTVTEIKESLPEKIEAPATTGRNKKVDKVKALKAREEVARKLAEMKKQVDETRRTSFSRRAGEDKEERSPRTAEKRPAGRTEPKIVSAPPAKKSAAGAERITAVNAGGQKIDYKIPGTDMLHTPLKDKDKDQEREEDLKLKAEILEKTLLTFDVEAKVVKINRGPIITLYELEPSLGTKVGRITSLEDEISLAMRSSNIRIIAPLPGKGTIGIEIPNDKREVVLIRDILETREYTEEESPLKFALGKGISGEPLIADLSKMPHLLIAGTTGSGKTVCLNCVISSLLLNTTPDEVKFIMIDPKRVELMMFEGIPHLASPIVTNPKKAAAALAWATSEMDKRYQIFGSNGVRNIAGYNEKNPDNKIPYLVIIVDELADLMMVARQDIEGCITRLAQLARAAGIHMIIATQRPSVNVITGVIKANLPSRISFKVASQVDSRTVLDQPGADKLLGRGDMLLMLPGEMSLIRGQCALVSDQEIRGIVDAVKGQAEPSYSEDLLASQEKRSQGVTSDDEKDDLYREAVKMVVMTRQASVSMIQRKLKVGYNRAARMIDIMEEEGIVGPFNGSKPRDIMVDDMSELEEKQAG